MSSSTAVPCTVGVESTIVDCTHDTPVILRLGGVSPERVEAIVGERVARRISGETSAPGTLPTHYAPAARVDPRRTPTEVAARAAALLDGGCRVGLLASAPLESGLPHDLVVLDPPGDADEYARTLYARLREADRRELDVLLVVPPSDEGIGAAVVDRLRRASAR